MAEGRAAARAGSQWVGVRVHILFGAALLYDLALPLDGASMLTSLARFLPLSACVDRAHRRLFRFAHLAHKVFISFLILFARARRELSTDGSPCPSHLYFLFYPFRSRATWGYW